MTSAPHSERRRGADTLLVGTPLDLIRHLEDPSNGLVTIILTGRFADDDDLRQFLRESYPRMELVVEQPFSELFDVRDFMVA